MDVLVLQHIACEPPGIYEDVLPASERKDVATLRAMLARDDYVVSVGELDGEVVGFTIRIVFAGGSAGMLEYMGVARSFQGQGLGRALFEATTPSD